MSMVSGVSMILVWLIFLVVMLVIEIITMGLTTIWFAGGALVAFVLALFNVPLVVQIFACLIVSLGLLFFTRPVAVKYFNKDRARTNIEGMIGAEAIVLSEIDNVQEVGRVSVGGKDWMARSSKNGVKIPAGTVVIVKSVSGVKLIVEEKREEI